MDTIIKRPKIEQITQLIELNRKHLIENLSLDEQKKGFIRIPYDKPDFEAIIKSNEISIALNDDKVSGYYMVGKHAITPNLTYQNNKAKILSNNLKIPFEKIGYACQVCIDSDYRHIGLFKSMLDFLVQSVSSKYTMLLCSVSDFNVASLKAHIKNGWEFYDKNNTTNFLIYNIQ